MRALLALVAALLWAGPLAAQPGIEPDDVRLDLVPEALDHTPMVGEMVLLSIQGTYRVPVVRETLQQPGLQGFDWMQLGEDRWYKAREDGFEVLKFERRMALFPQRPGPVEVPPFTHALELLARNGQTIATEWSSDALTIDAAPAEDTGGWWFPVRSLEVSDRWSNQPETLDPGGAALRIVALTVEGTAPQRIPPMPELTGAGAHIFPHPEQRIVALGPTGPITRVFWRWTIRPHQGSAGYLNPVPIRYFDSATRQMREIQLSAQRVAYSDGPQTVVADAPVPDGPAPEGPGGAVRLTLPALPGWSVPLSAVLGLLAGVAVMGRPGPGARLALPAWLRRDADRAALAAAVRRRDAWSVWVHARRVLGKRTPPEALLELERTLFAAEPSTPDLVRVRRAVSAAAAPDQTP